MALISGNLGQGGSEKQAVYLARALRDAGVMRPGEFLTGFVVPFEEENAMAERIVMLAQSADLRRRMGAAGPRRVEERYSIDGLA